MIVEGTGEGYPASRAPPEQGKGFFQRIGKPIFDLCMNFGELSGKGKALFLVATAVSAIALPIIGAIPALIIGGAIIGKSSSESSKFAQTTSKYFDTEYMIEGRSYNAPSKIDFDDLTGLYHFFIRSRSTTADKLSRKRLREDHFSDMWFRSTYRKNEFSLSK